MDKQHLLGLVEQLGDYVKVAPDEDLVKIQAVLELVQDAHTGKAAA